MYDEDDFNNPEVRDAINGTLRNVLNASGWVAAPTPRGRPLPGGRLEDGTIRQNEWICSQAHCGGEGRCGGPPARYHSRRNDL
jgi:hypothetical protein